MRIRHIALATDFSANARLASEHAVALASRFDAALTLLHVDDIGPLTIYKSSKTADFFDMWTIGKQQRLEKARRIALERGVRAEVALLDGTPWQATLKYATDHQVDLIVLGKQGARPVDRHLIGSTARHAVRHASLPVLIVPPSAKQPGEGDAVRGYPRVAFSTDFSRDSERGLAVCAELVDALDSQLVVRHVLELPLFASGPLPEALTDRATQAAEAELEASLDAISGGRPGRITSQLLVGPGVAQAIVDQERQIDLHVVCSHGKGAVAAALLGSTTERMVRLTSRPVLLLRRQYLDALFGASSRN